MKKILLIFTLILILAGCTSKTETGGCTLEMKNNTLTSVETRDFEYNKDSQVTKIVYKVNITSEEADVVRIYKEFYNKIVNHYESDESVTKSITDTKTGFEMNIVFDMSKVSESSKKKIAELNLTDSLLIDDIIKELEDVGFICGEPEESASPESTESATPDTTEDTKKDG